MGRVLEWGLLGVTPDKNKLSILETSRQPNVPGALKDAKFVFVRRDAKKTPLQNPYDGPFEVLERAPKHFVLQLGNQQDSVSIDRLKPAYIDQTKPFQVAQPPRRGRPPKLLKEVGSPKKATNPNSADR